MRRKSSLLAVAVSLLFSAAICQAQFKNGAQSTALTLPRISQGATVTQRVGLTDITVHYHRPQVNGRKVWGGMVPYGAVWRAGANENTTIAFTDPVTIEGKPLAKGVYGLHMIPGENEWTVIFSNNATSWGSFSYEQKEDALRVTVKPQASDFREALAYDFDDVKPDSAVVALHWEKLAVPFKVGVNVNDTVTASIARQLRNTGGFTWDGWDDASRYLLENKGNLDDAAKYVDRSIQIEERFENLLTKSQILTAQGKKSEGAALEAKALEKANAIQTHLFARQLMQDGDMKRAVEVFKSNAQKHPESWITHVGLARMYSNQGDFTKASSELKVAMSTAPDPQKPQLDTLLKRIDAKQDINK
jgi:tetratricopeptide (TPR) repeat protein